MLFLCTNTVSFMSFAVAKSFVRCWILFQEASDVCLIIQTLFMRLCIICPDIARSAAASCSILYARPVTRKIYCSTIEQVTTLKSFRLRDREDAFLTVMKSVELFFNSVRLPELNQNTPGQCKYHPLHYANFF